MTGERQAVVDLVRSKGLQRRAEPFRLSSGDWSRDYIDGKLALAHGADLRLAGQAVLAIAHRRGIDFDAVGGLTLGADPLAHAVAVIASKAWFTVRKEAKGHGSRRLVEGTVLAEGTRVLLVDDVISTGRSTLQALEAVEATGATVVLAACLIDRGPRCAAELARRGITYEPVATYADLGIEPVGEAPGRADPG